MILTTGSQKTDKQPNDIETLFEQYVKEMRFLRNFTATPGAVSGQG